eukprot:GHVT01024856.1.p2 GENE.GHVT01024856.1~~GHVT01024856.1.p2  ORF type:complete len:149 (-),score=15.74 GHVT01024856.1:1719-2165(-)
MLWLWRRNGKLSRPVGAWPGHVYSFRKKGHPASPPTPAASARPFRAKVPASVSLELRSVEFVSQVSTGLAKGCFSPGARGEVCASFWGQACWESDANTLGAAPGLVGSPQLVGRAGRWSEAGGATAAPLEEPAEPVPSEASAPASFGC